MDVKQLDAVMERAGIAHPDREKVKQTAATMFPAKTYNTAITYLGIVAVVLAVGSIVLSAMQVPVSEALWGALGASVGGLAGIFMAKS